MGLEIFKIIAYLYKQPNSTWIYELEEVPAPIIINRFLSMNWKNYRICNLLNKYIFCLEPKMFLLLAWSIIPKVERAPFVKYIKTQEDEEDEFNFLWNKVKKKNDFYGNDFKICKDRLDESLDKNMEIWFKSYGIEKKYWKKYNLDFKKMCEGKRCEKITNKDSLEGWF
jgi:hypothetical protein